MKKLLTAVLATALLSLGLVAAVEAPAQAACPYSACIPTKTKASFPKQVTGTSITGKVKVTPQTGTGTPPGTGRGAISKYNANFELNPPKTYAGGKLSYTLTGLPKKGKYRVLAKFFPGASSVYLKSKTRSNFIKTA